MKRRQFLAMMGATAPLVAWRRVYSQPAPTRAAVVIGINKSGTLPVLNAAVSGAREVSTWLRAEQFDVREFFDDKQPVTAGAIFKAIDDLLQPGTLQQLIVYFSGHGFQVGFGEYWLLSDAPHDPNASISHRESVELARRTDVPNIVFVSDACRSTADSLGMHGLSGQYIFPNTGSAGRGRVTIDQFFAALPGAYSLEVPVADSVAKHQGIYTAALLDAYRRPDSTMVRSVGGVNVVPNRLLKDYLLREVSRRAQAQSIRLTQRPESRVESDDSIYIGRAAALPPLPAGPGAPPPPPPPRRPATITDVANAALDSAGLTTAAPNFWLSDDEVAALDDTSGFSTQRVARLGVTAPRADVPRHFETKTGFVVFGAEVAGLTTSRPEMNAELLENGNGVSRPAVLRLRPVRGTLLVRFKDGSGAVVASLPEYIGTMIVGEAGVVDVSYLPSLNSSSYPGDSDMRRLDQLRASVATAAQYGVFRLQGSPDERKEGAEKLATAIRVMKSVDPTLGLYATYAYSDAGMPQQVASVLDAMRRDLNFDLFDVAMLARVLAGRRWEPDGLVEPFCPMLTQGWNLLRVNDASLPDAVQSAGAHLRGSLWTTFAARGIVLLEDFLRRQ